MQTVSQSYSSQVYIQMQNGFSSPVNRREADSTLPSNSQSSQQSTDDPITLSVEGRQRSRRLMNTSQSVGGAKRDTTAADKTGAVESHTFSVDEMKLVKELQRRDDFSRRMMTSAYQAIAEITS